MRRMMREVPPLHHVRHKQIIELLITAGVDVNAKFGRGATPLHGQSKIGNVELLIENGADVNAIIATGETQGNTPLDLASKAEISDLLRKHGGKTGDELKAEERRSTH